MSATFTGTYKCTRDSDVPADFHGNPSDPEPCLVVINLAKLNVFERAIAQEDEDFLRLLTDHGVVVAVNKDQIDLVGQDVQGAKSKIVKWFVILLSCFFFNRTRAFRAIFMQGE